MNIQPTNFQVYWHKMSYVKPADRIPQATRLESTNLSASERLGAVSSDCIVSRADGRSNRVAEDSSLFYWDDLKKINPWIYVSGC